MTTRENAARAAHDANYRSARLNTPIPEWDRLPRREREIWLEIVDAVFAVTGEPEASIRNAQRDASEALRQIYRTNAWLSGNIPDLEVPWQKTTDRLGERIEALETRLSEKL